MTIARSLAIKATNPALAALQRVNARKRQTADVNETLHAFVNGISAAGRTAALQLEQATQARRDDGLPIADDQLSGASLWSLIADSGRGAKRRQERSGTNDVPDGFQLDASDNDSDEATGASAVYFVTLPNTTVVIDDAGNAERTTVYAIGNVSVSDNDEYGRVIGSTARVSFRRETERDGNPVVVHVDPSCIAHAVMLSAVERIRRQAADDGLRVLPRMLKIWCSVGRWAGHSDAPGMAYSGWAWFSFNRAQEQERKAKIRAKRNLKAPLYTMDVSRARKSDDGIGASK